MASLQVCSYYQTLGLADKLPTDTIPGDSLQSPVSWQSVFWAVIAMALNVLLQNAGSVCARSSSWRIPLRSSPLICAADTILCLLELLWIKTLGCSWSTAARHVWYGRFEEPRTWAGSGVDSNWRWSMIAFVLGALPQFIKVFVMQGVIATQIIAIAFFGAFLVPEILRITAGVAYHVALRPCRECSAQRPVSRRYRPFLCG